MAQLPLQPPVAHLLARARVERGGVQRVGDALDDGRAELVTVGGEQPPRRLDERVDGVALALVGGAQRAAVAAPGQQVGLRLAQPVAGREELADRVALRAHELVDRPRGDRRLAQRRHLRRLVAALVGAQRLGQRAALGDEAVQRQAVEVVGLHRRMVPTFGAWHTTKPSPIASAV